MSDRLPQIVVEVTGGDVYVTHNLGDPTLVTVYDYDLADAKGYEAAQVAQAEVTEGQKYVDECHDEWGRYVREQDPDPHQQSELYDCSKDYWNDRGPENDTYWSD
jgi:hypothetical protein